MHAFHLIFSFKKDTLQRLCFIFFILNSLIFISLIITQGLALSKCNLYYHLKYFSAQLIIRFDLSDEGLVVECCLN
jgi:hypothetical protein